MKKQLRGVSLRSRSSQLSMFPSYSYDVVGKIAIIRSLSNEKTASEVAETILKRQKNIKTILAQTTKVAGDFRLRSLSYVAGENQSVTVHRESKCLFSVDVSKCYFSPRLSFERSRIADTVQPGETVVNMFAGVGCFSIMIAKRVERTLVFSIDVNPSAIQFLSENVRLNRVYGRVIPFLGDSEEIVCSRLRGVADRVLMPLPEKAFEYLSVALFALKPLGGWMHYYEFEHAVKHEDPAEKTKLRVAERLKSLGVSCEFPFSRVVRNVGPNWYQTVVDIHVKSIPNKS